MDYEYEKRQLELDAEYERKRIENVVYRSTQDLKRQQYNSSANSNTNIVNAVMNLNIFDAALLGSFIYLGYRMFGPYISMAGQFIKYLK